MENNFYRGVSVLFFDLNKAFDVIPHHILLKKLLEDSTLCKGTLPVGSISWLASYLLHRKQFVSIASFSSSLTDISSGVPQGSLLGPFLFIYSRI